VISRHAPATPLTGKIGIVDLDISDARIVQDLEFDLVRFGDICKVFFIVGVDARCICLFWSVSEVVPVGTRHEHSTIGGGISSPRGTGHRDLDVFPFFLRHEGLHVLELGKEGAVTGVGDLLDGDGDLVGNLFLVHERLNVLNVAIISIYSHRA
jgi:hypothetical protein